MKYKQIAPPTVKEMDKGYAVRLVTSVSTNGHYMVKGTLLHHGKPVAGAKKQKTWAKSSEEIPKVEEMVTCSLARMIPSATRHPAVSYGALIPYSKTALQEVFGAVRGSTDAVCPHWADHTRRAHMAYFGRHILPVLEPYVTSGEEYTEMDRQALEQALLDATLERKRCRGVLTTARATVRSHLAAAQVIINRLAALDPRIPRFRLSSGARPRVTHPEQAKSLPRAVRRALAQYIRCNLGQDPNYYYHLILMVAAGLRDAEACAATEETLEFLPHYSVVTVDRQIDRATGKVTPRLKTDSSYRRVVIDYWGTTLLRACIDALHRVGEHVTPIGNVSVFSARAKQILQECGCDDKFFVAAQVLMDRCPEIIDGEITLDVVTYVLRHDYASRAYNVCGLTSDEIDCLLGHARPSGAKRSGLNLARVDDQVEVAAALERYVWDPDISLHPGHHPVKLSLTQPTRPIPYPVYRFCLSPETPYIEMVIQSIEPGEPIRLTLPRGAKINGDIDVTEIPYDPRSARPVIGSAHDMAS